MSEPVILVPLDGSEQALAALPVAKVLGEIERAALHILHVGDTSWQQTSFAVDSDARLRSSMALPSMPASESRRWKFCRSQRR